MRLIDADELIEMIKDHNKKCSAVLSGAVKEIYEIAHEHIINLVEIQPTAYDVENVVEKLEEQSFGYYLTDGEAVDLEDAIECVRNGGKE